MSITKKAVMSFAIVGSLLGMAGTASADHATRDLCAGVVEDNSCWFCAYSFLPVGTDPTNCHYGLPSYTWEQCDYWVTAVCLSGVIDPG